MIQQVDSADKNFRQHYVGNIMRWRHKAMLRLRTASDQSVMISWLQLVLFFGQVTQDVNDLRHSRACGTGDRVLYKHYFIFYNENEKQISNPGQLNMDLSMQVVGIAGIGLSS